MQQSARVLVADQQAPVHDALRLVWQNPVTRKFVEVGLLSDLGEGRYSFEYTSGARDEDFFPLSEFPDLDRPYTSDQLPAFFANRVMSQRRENYAEYLSWLGLSDVPAPMEVLALTGGGRATDTFHVVDSFREHDGKRRGLFFASGISHISGADERLAMLQAGDTLGLRDDTLNPKNARAILLDARGGQEVGWVPDWLVDEIHAMRDSASKLAITVARVNLGAPAHLRLLCQIEAEEPPR